MRQIIAVSALVLFLVLALVLHQVGQRSKHDNLIIGWANSLIWEAIGSAASPVFENVAVSDGESAGTWTVAGQLWHGLDDEGLPAGDYDAEIERVCADSGERDCWRLKRLTVGGRLYVAAGLVALPGPDEAAGSPPREAPDDLEAPFGDAGAEPAPAEAETEPAGAETAPEPKPEPKPEPGPETTSLPSAADPVQPAAADGTAGGQSGLASLSALERVQSSLESDPQDGAPLVDQNGRPVPPIPRRNPR